MSRSKPAPHRQKGIRLSVAERYYERSLDQYTKGKLDLALDDMDAAIEHAPRNAELFAARGLMLLQAGWTAEAEADFAHALKLDPTQWIAHYGRGMRAFQERDFRQAIDHFSRAQQIAPERPEIYYHRAVAFYELDDHKQAILDMEVAVSLLTDNSRRLAQAQKWLRILRQAQDG